MNRPILFNTLRALFIFGAYYSTGAFGIKLASIGGLAAIVWPPTGIALGSLLLFGWRFWPIIFISSFAVNHTIGSGPVWADVLMAGGNALEAITGYYLLRRLVDLDNPLERLKDIVYLVVLGAILSTVISASIGVCGLYFTNRIQPAEFLMTWSVWWIANAMGILIFTPLLLVGNDAIRDRLNLKFSRDFFVASGIFAALVFVTLAVFGPWLSNVNDRAILYMIFPFHVWLCIRFRQRASVLAGLAVATISISGTSYDLGPFASHGIVQGLYDLQCFLAVLSITGLLFSSIATERHQGIEDINRHIGIERALREREEEVKALNATLERRVAERTEELERSNRELEQFAYIASHDLQEPLRSVTSFGALLEEDHKEGLSQKGREYVRFMIEGAQRMQELITGLLAYSRSGQDYRGEINPVPLSELVLRAERNLEKTIEESGAKIVVEKLPTVSVDGLQIVQVFQNLIGNAIKFQGEKPPLIQISSKQIGRAVEICISDNGIGIDPKYHERVFQIFQRLHTRDRFPGSGIGLSICKKIVEHHGGKVRIESAHGEGSKFYITLPIIENLAKVPSEINSLSSNFRSRPVDSVPDSIPDSV